MDQRRRILAALPLALAERGYSEISVRHVIEPAGVSRRTFYDLYESIADVFVAAHAEMLSLLCVRIDEACSVRAKWPLKVKAAIVSAVELAAEDPPGVWLLVGELFTAGPCPGYCYDLLVERFAPGLQAGRCQSSLDSFPSLEETLVGGLAGMVATRLRSGLAASLPILAPQLVEFILVPYLGPNEARRIARCGPAG